LAGRLVLVTDGGNGQGRSALAAVRALARGGWAPVVTTSGRWSLAAASRSTTAAVRLPADPDRYACALRAEARSGRYAAVVAASDLAVRSLGLPVARLLDKDVLAAEAGRAGLPSAPGQLYGSWAEVLDDAASLPFPVVVKPVRSTATAQAFRSAAELRCATARQGPVLVQRFIDEPMTAVCGLRHGGRLVAVAHQRYLRTWPVPCGTACAAVTAAPDPELEERLEHLLRGHDGVFQAQLAGGHLLDLNPRAYGSLPLAVAAGVNLVALDCELRTGGACWRGVRRGRVGVRYRWIEGDVRHVARGLRAGAMGWTDAVRALRPHRGTAHSVLALADPGPGLARAAFVLARRR